MPRYPEPESRPELRDAIRRLIATSGLSEAEVSRRLGYAAPSQLNRRLNDGKPTFTRDEIERLCGILKLDQETKIELLRLRGDVVIMQAGQPVQVVAVDQLSSMLDSLIEERLKPVIGGLPALIAEAVRGVIPMDILRAHLHQASQITVGNVSGTGIVIGDRAQATVITIESLELLLPPPPPPLDPHALLEALPASADDPIPPADRIALGAVPHRIELLPNELFTGRDDALRALARCLKAGQSMVVTTGMGGVGKTQLASEFAYRYGRYFAGGVFWIDCSVAERAPAEIAACGGPGGLDLPGFGELTVDQQVERVKQEWNMSIPRLLIFDNCEDEHLLRAHRPGAGGCRVLVTSRRQQWSRGQNLTPLDLDVLQRPFSIELLQKLANQHDPERLNVAQAGLIAAELGDLPLALHLAGSYLAAFPATSPDVFLRDIQQRRLTQPALANEDAVYVPTLETQRRASSLYAVLTIGLERLDPADAGGALARTLLARAACLAPAGVTFPRDFLSRTVPINSNDPEQQRLVDRAINLLINLGFLDLEAGGRLRMHRLIGAAVQQAQLVDDPMTSFAPAALHYCAELIRAADERISTSRVNEGRQILDREQALWRQFLDWSYHNETSQEPVHIGARATALLGNYWTLTGAKAKEETHERLRQALVAARRTGDRLGEANVRKAMGDVQQFRKETDAALASYQQALALYREIGAKLGEANVRKAMGDVQQFRAERDAALASYQQALRLFREIGDRLGEANVLQAIGDVQQFRDERDAALASYQQALALYRAIGDRLGEANVLAALSCLRLDDDPAESQHLLEQALALRRAIGSVYNEAADLGNYGIALLQRGRGAEALPYLERARDLFASRGLTQQAEQAERLIAQARAAALLSQLPPTVRAALEAQDQRAFDAAVAALSPEEQQQVEAILQALAAAVSPPDPLAPFEPLLAAIASVARGNVEQRPAVEAVLADLETKGWMLRAPVVRIWQGERDLASLIAGLDEQDTALIRRVLKLIE